LSGEEAGVQQKVHQKKYFAELLQTQKKEMPPSISLAPGGAFDRPDRLREPLHECMV
jgi:hypothetical protein